MVYCGKPSKGCGECRSRKIRCDQAQPACSQCTRAKRDCSGYRDQQALIFRDESKSVIRKAVAASTHRNKRAERSRRSAIPERHPMRPRLSTAPVGQVLDFNSDPQHINLTRQFGNRPLEVQPSQELEITKNEAICFFLRSTAVPGSFWTTEMISNILVQSGGTPSQKAMKASVVATAMAMLSRVRGLPSLRDVAHREYGSALRLLNAALTDMEEAKTNQTLGAVMVLAKYEVISSRAPEEIESWTNHISGAAALLDIRGADQLKTDAGLRLFLYLRYQITISCLQRDVRVPQSLFEQTEIAMLLQPEEVHGNRLVTIICNLSNLRADICANMYNDQEIISAASAIEASLIAWLAALPPEFNYTTHVIPPFDLSIQKRLRGIAPYDDQYHVYFSAWVCNSWNQYRSARIIVSEIILSRVWQLSDSSSLASLSEELRIQCKTLRSTIRRLAVDICRSVPFHFFAYQVDRVSSLPPPESYVGGLVLLWHLFVAGVVENPQHRLRRWVVKCLQMIGNTMGIDQALAVADLVAVDPGVLHSVTEEEDSHSSDQDLPRRDLVTAHGGNTCLGVYND